MSRTRRTENVDCGSLAHDDCEAALKRLVMSSPPFIKRRPREAYSCAEQHFSAFAQRQLLRLMSGKEDRFRLMRHYFDADEVAFFLPSRLDKSKIRARVAQDIIYGVLRFLHPSGMGGPIVQRHKEHRITESQIFPTRYPHLIVRKQDRYDESGSRHTEVEWEVLRLHFAEKPKLLDRTLEIGKIAIEIARFLPVI